MMYDETLWAEIIVLCLHALSEVEVYARLYRRFGTRKAVILANSWEYGNEKTFVARQELFREAEAERAKRSDI